MGKGCPISISTKQKLNTRSSTEAKIVGVNDAMYLVLWVRHFLESQGYSIKDNIVYQDNMSSMKLEINGKRSSTKNTRHMEIRYFFVTDNIRRGKLSTKHCPTNSMLGDYFTKPQQGTRMRHSRIDLMNLRKDPTLISQECVEACPSDKLVDSSRTGNTSANHCVCSHVSESSASEANASVVRYKAGSYLMAAKGLLKHVNKELNKVNSLYSINSN
jgi:hypothetical protein